MAASCAADSSLMLFFIDSNSCSRLVFISCAAAVVSIDSSSSDFRLSNSLRTEQTL